MLSFVKKINTFGGAPFPDRTNSMPIHFVSGAVEVIRGLFTLA